MARKGTWIVYQAWEVPGDYILVHIIMFGKNLALHYKVIPQNKEFVSVECFHLKCRVTENGAFPKRKRGD